MRLSTSATALVLLIGSGTIWAFCPATRSYSVRPTSRPFGTVSSVRTDTFLRATRISKKAQGIAEAKVCLTEIESAVTTARAYLKYLEDVALVVQAAVEGTEAPQIDTSGRPSLPELGDASVAQDYLSNILTAYSAAEDYLAYLEGVASNLREYLNKYESSTPAQAAQETKTRGILADLEETSEAAKEYLSYLKGVASAVEQFLADPSQPPPPELANALPSQQDAKLLPANGAVEVPSNFASPEYVPATPAPVESAPKAVSEPVNGATEVASEPVASAPAAPTSTGSYLDNISSSTAPARPSGGGIRSFADSMSSSGGGGSTAPAPAATSYIDKLASTENAPPKPDDESKAPETTASEPSETDIASSVDKLAFTENAPQKADKTPATTTASMPSGKAIASERNYLDSIGSQKTGTASSSSTAVANDPFPPGEEDADLSLASVFLSLLLVAAGVVFQYFNENPAQFDEMFTRLTSVVPKERVQPSPLNMRRVPAPVKKVTPAPPAPAPEAQLPELAPLSDPVPGPLPPSPPPAVVPEAKVAPAPPIVPEAKVEPPPAPPVVPEKKVVPATPAAPENKVVPAPAVPSEPFEDIDEWEF